MTVDHYAVWILC